jgi:hypothetical protein
VTDAPFKERSTDRRVVTWLLVGLVVLFGGLYVAGYVVTGDRIPKGTTVAGVAVGGLDPVAARTELERELGGRETQPFLVSADRQRFRIRPEQDGLAVDYAASVEQAGGGRSWNPGRMWDYFTGGDDLDAVAATDGARLGEAVERFAADVDAKPVEGRVVFARGEARPRYPQPGQQIDREEALAAIRAAYVRHLETPLDQAVPLEVDEVEPEVSEEAVRAAMDEFANPAMSAPVVLAIGKEDVRVRPGALARALSMEPEDGALVPVVRPKKLMRVIRPAMDTVALAPVSATVRLVDGEPQVVPGMNGVTFDPEAVAEALPDVLVKTRGERRLEVEARVDRPDFTTKDARALNIEEAVSSFSTYYPHSDYRNTNIGRAAELVNGTVLKPGETFSLNDTVGERTRENGFTEGFIISDGVFKEDLGGGVSQVATTLYNGAFFAGLEDVEHKAHSFYIDRYPVGREATVAWGAVDLKFRNDTPHGVLIQAWITPSSPSVRGSMNVRFWSTQHWEIGTGQSERYNITEEETRYIEGEDCVPNNGYGGFDIDVYRIFREPGSDEVVRRETITTRYTPSDTVVCGPKPRSKRD